MRTWKEYKEETRRRYLLRLLIHCNCIVSEAAQIAGMNRTDLYKQIIRYKIDVPGLAKELLERGKAEVINKKVRRSLERKSGDRPKPNWDRPIPGYQPYEPAQKNNNVRN